MNNFKKVQSGIEKTITHWLHIDLSNDSQRNGYYLILEIFFATFLSAAAAFNSAYAIRLGAGDEQISLLTSIPALFAVIISIPAGRFLEKSTKRKTLLLRLLFIHRLGYLAIVFVPFFQALNLDTGSLVVWTLILFTLPAHVFNIGFTALSAKVLHPNQRGAVFSLRNQIFFAVSSICSFLLGFWLDAIIFPLNYQLMYGVTFLIATISLIFLNKLDVPEDRKSDGKKKKREPIRLKTLIEDFRQNPQFTRFSINTFIMDFGLWAIIPLFTVYYVNELGATESWLGLLGAFGSVTNIIGFGVWNRIVNRYGRDKVLLFTSLLRPIFPFVVAVFPNLTAIMLVNAVTGLLMPGLSVSHYSMLMDAIPNDRRDQFTAYFTMFSNASVFLGPLVGAAVAQVADYRVTFLIFGGLRLIGGLMWRFLPVNVKAQEELEKEAEVAQ